MPRLVSFCTNPRHFPLHHPKTQSNLLGYFHSENTFDGQETVDLKYPGDVLRYFC